MRHQFILRNEKGVFYQYLLQTKSIDVIPTNRFSSILQKPFYYTFLILYATNRTIVPLIISHNTQICPVSTIPQNHSVYIPCSFLCGAPKICPIAIATIIRSGRKTVIICSISTIIPAIPRFKFCSRDI